MDTVYPQPIRLRLEERQRRNRGSQNRYRTQPVTFSEIKEVDEENADEEDPEPDAYRRMSAESGSVMSSKSSSNVNAKFEELFGRRRTNRRINRRLQNRLDLARKPSVSSIPGSPENGKDNPDPMTSTIESNNNSLSIIPKNVTDMAKSESNQNSS